MLSHFKSGPAGAAFVLGLVVAGTMAIAQPSNVPRPEFWTTDDAVYALAENCGTLFIGGAFSLVGPATGGAALLDVNTGRARLPFPRFEGGSVDVVTPDGSGGWYVGGNFMLVDGISRSRLVHILPDHSVDATWSPNPNAGVNAITVAGGRVYVGGAFQQFFGGGQSRNRLAAFDAATGQLESWAPNVSTPASFISSIVVSEGIVYVGGSFTAIDGQTRRRLAALDANAASSPYVLPWDPNSTSSGAVRTMALSGNVLYVGGEFNGTIGNATRSRIAALRTTDGQATSWNPGATGAVRAISAQNNLVFAAGGFANIGGANRNGIAALLTTSDSNNATPWDPNAQPAGSVYSLAVSGNTVYIGGEFTSVDGMPRNRIAAIDALATSNYATGWNPNATNDRVAALAVDGGEIVAGGTFTSIGRVARNRIAAIDIRTGDATPWNPNADGDVRAIAVSGQTIYAGGAFTNIGGQSRSRIAALDINDGTAITGWNPSIGGFVPSVYSLAVSNSILYAGGSFTTVNGQARNSLAACEAATGALTDWNPNATGQVFAIVPSNAGDVIYVGGTFGFMSGQTRNGLAAITPGGVLTGWNPDVFNQRVVNAIAIAGSTIYAAGNFTSVSGQARARIAAVDAITGIPTSWNPAADTEVRTLTVLGGHILAGGNFTIAGGQNRNRLAELEAVSNNATSWNPDTDVSVSAICASGGRIYIGGAFTTIGGRSRRGLAAFSLINSSWTGTTGVWSDPLNWSDGVVPDNNVGCGQFNVSIAGATSDVTLDSNRTINSVTMESAGTLEISQGNLTLATAEGVTNNANLLIGTNQALIAGAPMTVGGSQPIQLTGPNAGLSSLAAANVITLTTDIVGQGAIDAAFINQGRTIDANVSGRTLDIFGGLSALSTGTLKASNGGTLLLNRSIAGTSALVADGGLLLVPGFSATSIAGRSLDVRSGGEARFDGLCQAAVSQYARLRCFGMVRPDSPQPNSLPGEMRGCTPPLLSVVGSAEFELGGDLDVEGPGEARLAGTSITAVAGHVRFGCGQPFRGCTPPLLDMNQTPLLKIGGNIEFGDPAIATVRQGAVVRLGGHFVNQLFEASRNTFDWLGGAITMEGSSQQTFELAGEDFGDDPAGFTNNFAMGTVRVEPGRSVSFINAVDNIAASPCEVLYVDTLSLGAGSTISVACRIYYRRLINGGATILPNEDVLQSAVVGDVDCNGIVGGGDIQALVLLLTDPAGFAAAHPACDTLNSDLDESGSVDVNDIAGFVEFLLQGI